LRSNAVLSGRILTPGWINSSIAFDQRIQHIREDNGADSTLTILPGFIDLHVHGAAGVDIMQGGDAGATVARAHARHGTTAMLGTTMTATDNSIRRALRGLAPTIAERPTGAARMLGVHLEGPSSASTGSARSRPMPSRSAAWTWCAAITPGADPRHDAGHRSRRPSGTDTATE
jgi:N-acetylglucosamine-6-phosphate deacetylase